MNKKKIAYFATTGLLAAAFAFGGFADLAQGPEMKAAMAHLGYPTYFLVILGVWKVLGAVTVLAPGLPRLKEWAYAGITFDLTGAAISHAVSGDPPSAIITPLVILAIAAASWALRPEDRKFGAKQAAPSSARGGAQPSPVAA